MLEEGLLLMRFDERIAERVHRSVINVGFQLDRGDVDTDEVALGVAVVCFELAASVS